MPEVPQADDRESPHEEAPRKALTFGDNVRVLDRPGGRKLYLVGTAHVSEHSVREVEAIIDAVQPDTVCVELCKTRLDALTQSDRFRNLDLFKVIREGKSLYLLSNLAVGAYQRRLGAKLGVTPGAELVAAVKKAEASGAALELVDRDIQITLKRTWGNLGFWTKCRLLGAMFEAQFEHADPSAADIEQLKQLKNLSELMAEFARAFPEVQRPLIAERDEYLMEKVQKAPGDVVVAVVGAAHVPGMMEQLDKSIDIAPLEQLPPKSWFGTAIQWLFPAVILGAFAFGTLDGKGATFSQMLLAWILPTSTLCAIGTMLGGAKPGTVVSGFLAAPLTTLHPLIGAGMVTGIVEAWLRKPTVADAERINEDVQSLAGFYRNPVTRVLVVFFTSSVGAALGAWVGLAWVLKLVS